MKKKLGIGSISLVLFVIAFFWAFNVRGFCLGDKVLTALNIPTWSNNLNASGTHYTVFYSVLFLIPSIVIAFKYKDDMFAKVGKWLSIILLCLLVVGSVFMIENKQEANPFDSIKYSVSAKMELPDGTKTFVDSEIDTLKPLGDMEFAILEDPDAMEQKWIYAITYNPVEKVKDSKEIRVLFYGDYIKIDDKCYAPSDDAEYKNILMWTKSKFDYLMPTE